ncbi:hypothetical protein Ssi03_00420 [Sphaerisporangium siamense]|uniref:Uncharacterized membrane protein YciS (DUF1049 family) n=1 Tax=Sphaerisporangium siamense TaxID=795645 RepID=A0A7W7DDB5_9ACTN|nr:hypothetical protein [Sphaerisporangium siamense]MBB4703581.1 uncharacterized membrane protein YciS (DUF1049 family) [Sphaerisporangium siamense]GII82052.1 hypothetical protein Ssi03_00420 [Sphaerisporangium siamense]
MTWIYLAVGLAVAGLVPVALLTARVLVAVRGLTREIERTTRRLESVRPAATASAGRIEGPGGVK